jgi:hypothetical protein
MPHKDAETAAAWQRNYRGRNRDKLRESKRAWSKTEKGKTCNWRKQIKRFYGLSEGEYNRMLVAQNHLCAICREVEIETVKEKVLRLAVDHNHATGKVRGLLCRRCNRAIGLLRENPVYIRAAADYLEKTDG